MTALMTAFYMFRLMYLTFYGKPRMSHEVEHHIHESPKSMTMPLDGPGRYARLFAGFLGWPHSLGSARIASRNSSIRCFPAKLQCSEPKRERPDNSRRARRKRSTPVRIEYLLMFFRSARRSWDGCMAGRAYRNADKGYAEPIATAAPPVYNTLLNKYYVDEGYDYAVHGTTQDRRRAAWARWAWARRVRGSIHTSSMAR